MKGETASYRRRDDGTLEIVRTTSRRGETVRGFEIAIAVVVLVVGAAAALTGNGMLGLVLLLGGIGIVASRLVRDRLAALAAKRSPIGPARPSSSDQVGLRVIRFEERASPAARVPGTAVRLPGTAASPQE